MLFWFLFLFFQVIHGVRIETVESTATTNSIENAPAQHDNDVNTVTHSNPEHHPHSRRKKRSTVDRPLRISLVYDDSVIG